MPTYRYRRANETEPVEIVAASYELAPSGVAVFHDVTEENGEPLRRTVEVRRVRMTGDVELPERLDEGEVELRLESLVRAREVERQRLESLLRARDLELRLERLAYSRTRQL
jgi:hypothetical protein